MPCNRGQTREQKTAYLCGICKPMQTQATTDRTLVMSRSAVRVRSSALLFTCKYCKKVEYPARSTGGLAAVEQQYTLSQKMRREGRPPKTHYPVGVCKL